MTSVRPKLPQKPLVVCVGFLGSKPRHVQKYADLVSSLDINVAPLSSTTPIYTKPEVIQYIPPISTFTSYAKIRASGLGLANAIENKLQTPAPLDSLTQGRMLLPYQTVPLKTPDHILNDINNYQPRKIVFLTLSNNGAFGFANMQNLLRKENPALFHRINSQTAGIIWDSGPSHPTADVFERGFVSALGTILGRPPTAKDPILTPLVGALVSFLLKTELYQKAAQEVTEVLEYSVPYHAPQLYLITEKDDLVLPDATREYVKNRSQRVKEFFKKFSKHGNYAGIGSDEASALPTDGAVGQKPGPKLEVAEDGVVNPGQYKLNFELNGTKVDQKTPQFSPQYSQINRDIKSGIDFNLVDQHQAGFALGYNYNQHIFPHFSSLETEEAQKAVRNGDFPHLGNFGVGTGDEHCRTHHHYHRHHQATTKYLQTHFHSLDLKKLPPLADHHSLVTLAMHRSAHLHGVPHQQGHEDEHHDHDHDHPTHAHGHDTLNTSSSSSTHSRSDIDIDSHVTTPYPDPDNFEPTYLDHSKYCPHTHHIDVIFDPKQKIKLQQLVNDPKIKPLFDRTEREPDCYHHFLYDFKDSAHVQHIRKHPQEYKELVDAFCNYAFRG